MPRPFLVLCVVLALVSAASGADFQVTRVPDVTDVAPPKPFDRASLKQAQGVGMADLQKYSVAAGLDKSDATPREKAEEWRKLAKDAPSLAAIAGKRAGEWETYATKVEDELNKRKTVAMESDRKRLRRLLLDRATSDADRTAWTSRFLEAYVKTPGIGCTTAMDLYSRLPPGPVKDTLAECDQIARFSFSISMERAVYKRIEGGGGSRIGIGALRKLYASRDRAWQQSDKGEAVRQAVKAMDDRDWSFRFVEDEKGTTMSLGRRNVGDPVYVPGRRYPDFTSLESGIDGDVADDMVNWILDDQRSPMSAPYKAALKAIRGEEVPKP